MKFTELNGMIPYVLGGKQKVLTMTPYPNITLAMPGRHAKDTLPKGGDFVVMVDDREMKWKKHQFTHTDLFQDLEVKADQQPVMTTTLMADYLDIIRGAAPALWMVEISAGLNAQTFLHAVQCLAVAEHRRYAVHEQRYGGRYLPFRFGAGIAEGLWTAAEAAEKQKRGRPGVEWLEKDHGMPTLTKELING
jgi:hypothetical protein